jgi:hypothetical protein
MLASRPVLLPTVYRMTKRDLENALGGCEQLAGGWLAPTGARLAFGQPACCRRLTDSRLLFPGWPLALSGSGPGGPRVAPDWLDFLPPAVFSKERRTRN